MRKLLMIVLTVFAGVLLTACQPKKQSGITIRYAAWNLGSVNENNIERRMINAFREKYPHIKVEVIERAKVIDEEGNEVDATWDAFFSTSAAANKMPDVFQVDGVVKAINNGWIENVADLANADSEYLAIPEDIRKDAVYNNKVFALPQAMYYLGYFINRTVINQTGAGAIVPEYGISYEELMQAGKVNSRAAVIGGDGIAGIDGVNHLYSWLPAQYDKTLGWFTHNESGYHLDSTAFRLAMEEQQKYFGAGKKQYESFVLEIQENRDDRYGQGNVFENGKQSITWEGSYNLRNWLAYTQDSTKPLFGNDIDFIGTPSVTYNGETNHRIPIILDYIGIGQGTKHKEEAYLFAKWMGFGVDGYKTRLEIAKNNPTAGAVNFAPITKNEELVEAYFELYPTLVEYKKIVLEHSDFIIESLGKTVPGYVNSRWNGKYNADMTFTKVLDEIRDGNMSLADVLAAGLNTLINAEYTTAKKELESHTK